MLKSVPAQKSQVLQKSATKVSGKLELSEIVRRECHGSSVTKAEHLRGCGKLLGRWWDHGAWHAEGRGWGGRLIIFQLGEGPGW